MKRFQEGITFRFRVSIVWGKREIIFTAEHRSTVIPRLTSDCANEFFG